MHRNARATWASYRKILRCVVVAVILLLPYIPCVGLIFIIFDPPRIWLFAAFGPYALMLLYINVRLIFWPCPRCQRSFH